MQKKGPPLPGVKCPLLVTCCLILFGAFLTVGSALEFAGTLVYDYTIGSKLQLGAALLPNAETGSLEYGNSHLE